MGAKIASFLATLILSIPLAAIGLMAVFGIPQLVPANGGAGNSRDTVIRGVRDAIWGEAPSSARNEIQSVPAFEEDAPRYGNDSRDAEALPVQNAFPGNQSSYSDSSADHMGRGPAFGSAPQSGRSAPKEAGSYAVSDGFGSSSQQHWGETSAGSRDLSRRSAALQDRPIEHTHSHDAFAAAPPAQISPAGDSQNPMLSWRQASVRLNELGIKKYHLERGAGEGSFLFVCIYSPGDAPHVVHRFESEADDPLIAVNQVLGQIDRWMRTRYASANFPAKPQSISLTAGPQSR